MVDWAVQDKMARIKINGSFDIVMYAIRFDLCLLLIVDPVRVLKQFHHQLDFFMAAYCAIQLYRLVVFACKSTGCTRAQI